MINKSKNKIKIKKGDEVIVLAGKNKGKTGKVLTVMPSINKLVVAGINIAKKHMKPSDKQSGGITEKEMPMQVSNVAYHDKESKKGIRIGYSFLKDGTKIRINKTNKKEIS